MQPNSISWRIATAGLFAIAAIQLSASESDAGAPAIIPRPWSIEVAEGAFEVQSSTKILATHDAMPAARFLQALLSRSTGCTLTIDEVEDCVPARDCMLLSASGIPDSQAAESYHLDVTEKCVQIRANDAAGAFYGVQTVRQLLPVQIEKQKPESRVLRCAIQAVKIQDHPRFHWRGMHLDVGRQYFPVDFIKRFLDLMALHKLNVFHWHLTDDQGWRIEIKRFPLLTAVGATKWGTRHRIPLKPHQQRASGYYYTQDEIREVVAYAGQHSISVVPEIDVPGHCQAVLASYPRLGCEANPDQHREGTTPATGEQNVLCAGNDEVYTFLEEAIDEVLDLFPGKFIHVGGDEVCRDRWHICPRCRTKMRDEGLKSETELQAYFTDRMRKILESRGRRLIGWDEIREGGASTDVAIMAWRNLGEAAAALEQGHEVVVCTGYSTYFNFPQTPANVSLERVYHFNPIPSSVAEPNIGRVLGIQGCLWCESVSTPEEAEELTLPRMSALAEVAWSDAENRNWPDFQRRASALMQRYDAIGVRFYNPPSWVELYLVIGKRRIAMIIFLGMLMVVFVRGLRSRGRGPIGLIWRFRGHGKRT